MSSFDEAEPALKCFQDTFFHFLILSDRFPREMVRLLIDQARMVNEQFPIFLISGNNKEAETFCADDDPNFLSFSEPLDVKLLERFCLQKIEELKLRNQVAYLRHREPYIYNFDNIIGHDSGLRGVVESIKKVSQSNCSVLLTGQTGTGKELIAAALHYNSLRRDENFVAVNCAALHENLLESELFGHEKGAFTGADKRRIGRFEQANGGTLFLDEVGEMSLATQAKVLRILQNQQFERLGSSQTICVDVRIVTATNRDLKQAIIEGRFRDDLFYRLDVFPIRIPPLVQRRQDIPMLSRFFLNKFRSEYRKNVEGVHPKGIKKMMEYNWPGNVRELQNVIERAVLLSEGPMISHDDIRFDVTSGEAAACSVAADAKETVTLDELERTHIKRVLAQTKGVQKDAAVILGVSPRALHYKIGKYGIDVNQFK